MKKEVFTGRMIKEQSIQKERKKKQRKGPWESSTEEEIGQTGCSLSIFVMMMMMMMMMMNNVSNRISNEHKDLGLWK